jgi:hypothetical protein
MILEKLVWDAEFSNSNISYELKIRNFNKLYPIIWPKKTPYFRVYRPHFWQEFTLQNGLYTEFIKKT